MNPSPAITPPSTSAAPSQLHALKHVLTHLVTPLLMCVGMGLAYLGAFAHPAPHHMPVAIVGSGPQVQQLASAVTAKAGEALDVTTVATSGQARTMLLDRDIVGAYLPDPTGPQLLVAKGASPASSQVAQELFTRVATLSHQPLKVTDVTTLASGDPTGQGLFFFLVALSLGSYASVAAIGAAGAALSNRTRVGVIAGTAVVVSTIAVALAGPVFGVIPSSHVIPAWALGLLYSAGILTVGVGLHTFLKRWTTLVVMALFVMLNFTSSGGIFTPDLQSSFFGFLHGFWNGAGIIEGMRGMLYLGGDEVARRTLTLGGWLVLGLALMTAAAWAERRRAARTAPALESISETTLDEELEEAAAVPV
jgi:hypothetical protein